MDTPALYRRKPSEAEALQWTGSNYREVREFCGIFVARTSTRANGKGSHRGMVKLLSGKSGAQGWVDVPVGHWILFADDHYWPVDNDSFIANYEPVKGAEHGTTEG